MTAATIPFTAPHSSSRPWSPSDRDRLIFQWVTFDGHKQSWVAHQLGIDRSTVSRIVDRYQKWIARGGPAYHGSPSHEERIRAQRWLTYERNEWILASALRIAGEMEHATEGSRTVIARNMANPSMETEMRSESRTIDRSGIACRFLRLAHRINMDQKKLIEEEPLPPLEPLSIEEVGDDQLPALANCGPLAPQAGNPPSTPIDERCHGHPAHADRANEACPADDPSNEPSELVVPNEQPATNSKSLPDPQPDMHQTHNPEPTEIGATDDQPIPSAEIPATKKPPTTAYPVALTPPEATDSADLISGGDLREANAAHRSNGDFDHSPLTTDD